MDGFCMHWRTWLETRMMAWSPLPRSP
jgi:hypothetical protein